MPSFLHKTVEILTPKSIHRFLVTAFLVILTITMTFIGMSTYHLLSTQNTQVLKAQLVQSADIIDAIVNLNNTQDSKTIGKIYNQLNTSQCIPKHGDISYRPYTDQTKSWSLFQNDLMFQSWNTTNGTLLIKSSNAPQKVIVTNASGFGHYVNHQTTWLTFTLSNPQNQTRTIVAIPNSNKINLTVFLRDLTLLFMAYLIIGLLVVWIVQFGFSPLRKITNELSYKDANNLHQLQFQGVPIEVSPLIKELNRLFKRLSDAIEREKRFAADAAHELRTPLAALKTQVEVARREKDDKQRERILQNIVLSSNRCARVVEQMLTLSRIEPHGISGQKETLDLVEVSRSMLAELGPPAIAKDIELSLNAPDIVHIQGSTISIGILLRNLLENAIRHTPNGGQIDVTITKSANKVSLSVIDSGPGIPKELQERIFDRFYSQPGSKSKGSGLGLSIVKQICQLHDARVYAKNSAQAAGLKVVVEFKPMKKPYKT